MVSFCSAASILPITYGYIKMLGESGLRRATETAIVQAMIENGRKTRRYSGLRARLAGEG